MEKKKEKNAKNIPKVAVALSGGVDSGVAAALLVKRGFRVSGCHLHLWSESLKDKGLKDKGLENKCCSTESLESARKTAHQLGIPFYILNFEKKFKAKVVDYFLKEYQQGRTPNPCVMCNWFIKFGELLDYVQKLGYDYLATGHYARITKDKNEFQLLAGKDKKKDQSYFLYNLTQKQLAQVMFPVGEYEKKEVVKMARKLKLPVAERPESQEVCFYPETDYRPFLKRQLKGKIKPGKVVDSKGKVIGEHQGLPLYTIGQRHGFEITDKKTLGPLYVIKKEARKNQLRVGFGKEAETKEFQVKKVNWVSGTSPKNEFKGLIKIRHQGEFLKGKIRVNKKRIKVILNEGERGVAPGQAAVFHQGKKVVGGGLIAVDIKD